MKTNRTLASICLALSCCALITAAGVSVGDQPGVVRMASDEQTFDPPTPAPPADGAPATTQDGGDAALNQNGSAAPQVQNGAGQPMMQGGPFFPGNPGFQPFDFDPYFQQSAAATEAPFIGPQGSSNPPFGPIMMYELNTDGGLGYDEGFHRANVRLPWHVVPGNSVLMADVSASVTNNQHTLYNFGAIWRNYDAFQNRVWGWNAYFDLDDGRNNKQWKRIGAGFESLGRWIDVRGNLYHVSGGESVLLNDRLMGDLVLGGSSVFRTRNQTRDNAYSGVDFEVGGPLPVFGRRGANMYVGGYWLDSEYGNETLGFSARWELLATESLTVNANLTTDDNFGTNSWVNLSYEIPNYKERAILRPRRVADRLADPVRRSNRVHSNIDVINVQEAVVNAKTGMPYRVAYVDPNASSASALGAGLGTLEDPYTSLQVLSANNNSAIDIIRINPREDDTNTNLTVNGGLDLFDCQVLLSSTKTYTLFSEAGMDFDIPGVPSATGFGPLVSNPTMVAGGSVIRVANENTVMGLRIDGANAAGTVFGTGITNPLPFTDVSIVCNTFTRYETAVNLMDGNGTIIIDENTADGLAGASQSGVVLTTANGSMTDLLVRNNVIDDNATTGIRITAGPGSTINADNPNGLTTTGRTQITGIFGENESDPTDPTGASVRTRQRVTNGGQGIEVIASAGATVNALVRNNQSMGNTFNGFVGRADGAGSVFNLVSMSDNMFNSNLENGALLHYLNGGMFRAVTEDTNGDGMIDPGEDINGNGLLDEGIVTNVMNNNSLAGLCIYGQNASTGVFDIGGPAASLGNTFIGNTGAGVAVDLQDTATAQIDALFNTIQGGNANPGLTIVLDFIEPGQGSVVDALGRTVNPFDVTLYGFQPTDFGLVTNAIRDTIVGHYRNIPTTGQNAASPIPDGMELDVDFVIGDTGVAPSNGATEYYVMTLGDSAANLGGLAGQAADIGNIRNAQGLGPGMGLFGVPQANGASAMAVYLNQINQFSPLLTPPDAFTGPAFPEPIIVEDPSKTPQFAINALTSGNLTFTRRAIGLVASHELGHTVSLRHIQQGNAVTPNGLNAIMATPAIDSPLQTLLEPAEFAFSGTNPGELPGEAPFVQNNIAQMVSALGLRVAAGETRNGVTVTGTNNSRLLASTFNNNTIVGARDHGINIEMRDNAVAEGVTVQSNSITGGAGHGVRLNANGPGARINADNTIGGAGTNALREGTFSQGNTITGNAGDGFRALAQNGGTIYGNLIANEISSNGRNGASLYVENGGTVDFGTTANRHITGNNLSDNGAAGLELISNVSATSLGRIDAVVRNNTILRNGTGGILSSMSGPNTGGATNNLINLTVGGTAAQSNTIDANGGVGVGFSTAGNAKGNLDLRNASITGTTGTPGHGIALNRQDSSLLTATIENVTSSGNAGDGLNVDVQGNDRTDPTQPMTGTINTVSWNRNNLSGNTNNGATFQTRGDAQLIADGVNNVVTNNGNHGIEIATSENSSFGDPTGSEDFNMNGMLDPHEDINGNGVLDPGEDLGNGILDPGEDLNGNGVLDAGEDRGNGIIDPAEDQNGNGLIDNLPPGRRTRITGTIVTGNGVDGFNINATESSRVLAEITSIRAAGSSGAHAGLNTSGDTNISNNGRDGIRINTTGGASDILITSSTGNTTISGNGTAGGGNGIRWDASGTSVGTVRIRSTTISGNLAGAVEDPALNNNGVLDPGEDVNRNGILDGAEDDNSDIDTEDGDGIQYNVAGTATSSLIVGGTAPGDGNFIQNNADDGIAITTTGSNPSVSVPIVSIIGNTIGGEADGVPAGNGGDGMSLNHFGGTDDVASIGADPANIDTDANDGLLSFSGGVTESGPRIQMTMRNNTVTNNNGRGANLLLHGAGGIRDRENGNSIFDPIRITMTGNTISSNGTEGVFLRADSDMNQGRLTYLANFPFPDPPFNPADDRPQFFGFYDPILPQFQTGNAGSVNGNSAFSDQAADGEQGYLNLRTVQNTFLTFTGNTVQSNGVNTITGEGLVLQVGTGSYLAADVQGNVFGGNLEEDVRTESFLSAGNTYDSVDDAGNLTFDAIYHDDTAQLDMRFINNSGNQIFVTDDGAEYRNNDALKRAQLGFDFSGLNQFGVTDRDAAFFQVDDGPNLNNPNNRFINFGQTQTIDTAFGTDGGFNVRSGPDGAFPNIGFAPFLP